MKKRDYDVPNYKGSYIEQGTSVLRNKLDIKDETKIFLQETLGFANAEEHFLNSLTKRTRFTSKYICNIHKMALGEIYYFAGRYRTVDLSKAGHNFFPHPYIATAMQYLEKEYLINLPVNYSSKEKLIEDIAVTHVEFIHIHPFREGNGRTARIFANLISVRAGYDKLNFENFRRDYYQRYIDALNKGDDKDYSGMIEIIKE
ncbi:MAG: cell filamentation protein Fic, partial [Ignavibacteria bacterium]|nr:cell filamentation protein Fic [Ignavibacteria bacterium]